MQEGYDIIRMIETGTRCYTVMDYAKGQLLVHYIKKCPNISREQLFNWFGEIIGQLEKFHRSRADPCYQYLNPYSAVVLGNQRLALLDLRIESNAVVANNHGGEKLQKNFQIEKHKVKKSEISKMQRDIYSLGKTLQYILAKTIVTPKLSKKEEVKLGRIIEKCITVDSKHQYQNIKKILQEVKRISC